MAGADSAGAHLFPHGVGQGQQPQRVGHGAAAFADALGGLFLGQAVFVNQAAAAFGHFDRVKVFALQVFNQCKGGGLFVGNILDNNRHFIQPGFMGGAPAAFARNDDIPGAGLFGPHRNRLQQAVFPDRIAQRGQRFHIKVFAGLVGVGLDLGKRQTCHAAGFRLGQVCKEAVQPAPQTAEFSFCQ